MNKPLHGRYILEGKVPVPCDDLLQWARWIEDSKQRIVAQEYVGDLWVSTVFMGLDHSFSDTAPPLLFETMVFRYANPADEMEAAAHGYTCPRHLQVDDAPCYREPTWELALESHVQAVQWAREQLS
jgi:hypothetical protein